jgi:hypothetical protein
VRIQERTPGALGVVLCEVPDGLLCPSRSELRLPPIGPELVELLERSCRAPCAIPYRSPLPAATGVTVTGSINVGANPPH